MTGRIGIINPYWSFWESAVEGDFAQDRRDLAAMGETTLANSAEIAWSVSVQPGDDIPALAETLPNDVDAIVVVSTMAASPGAVLALLASFPRTPIVVWAAHLGLAVDQDLSHSGITLRGATVGTPMIGADLTRQGRPGGARQPRRRGELRSDPRQVGRARLALRGGGWPTHRCRRYGPFHRADRSGLWHSQRGVRVRIRAYY